MINIYIIVAKSKSNKILQLHILSKSKKIISIYTYKSFKPNHFHWIENKIKNFIFIINHICITKTYTVKQKNKKFKSFTAFYNLIHICIKLNQSIKRLQSDYGLELQSSKIDK